MAKSLADVMMEAAAEGDQRTAQGAAPQVNPTGDSDSAFSGTGAHVVADSGAPTQPEPQAQPQTRPTRPASQASAQPQGIFIPEDFESPTSLRAKATGIKARASALREKLARATEKDHNLNPFATQQGNDQNGQPNYVFDQLTYDAAKLQLDQCNEEAREIDWKLRDMQQQQQSMTSKVESAAVNFIKSALNGGGVRLAKKYHQDVARSYGQHVQYLINNGFLLDPKNLGGPNLEATFRGVLNAAIGGVVSSAGSDSGEGPVNNGADDDPHQPTADEDRFKGWPEESVRMFKAFERTDGQRDGVLADQRKKITPQPSVHPNEGSGR